MSTNYESETIPKPETSTIYEPETIPETGNEYYL